MAISSENILDYERVVINFDEVKAQTGSEIIEISYFKPPVGKLNDGQYVAIFNVLADHGFTPEENYKYGMPNWMNNQLLINISTNGEKKYCLRYVDDKMIDIDTMISGHSPIFFDHWKICRYNLHFRLYLKNAKKKVLLSTGETISDMEFPAGLMDDSSYTIFTVKASYPLDGEVPSDFREKEKLPDWANNMLTTQNHQDLGSSVVYPVCLRHTRN